MEAVDCKIYFATIINAKVVKTIFMTASYSDNALNLDTKLFLGTKLEYKSCEVFFEQKTAMHLSMM